MYVCIWFNKKLNRMKLENVKLDEKVTDFKNIALNSLEKKSDNLEFTYRGCVLKDENTLSDYDINEDSEIHVIEKHPIKPCIKPSVVTNDEIKSVSYVYRNITQYAGFRSTVLRIVRSGFLNDIHKLVPDISSDPKAISILSDPELLMHLTNAQTLLSLSEKCPALIKAAIILGKQINEQSNTVQNLPTTSTGYSYSLDALSEDDDMDLSTESSRGSNSISRNASYNAITSAQLAAAIANATNSSFNSPSSGVPSTPGETPNVITNEMFSSALQQAFGVSTPSGTPPVTPVDSDESLLTTRYENELRHMHELGLLNDRINLRALQATSGNLQEAVELVLTGVMD